MLLDEIQCSTLSTIPGKEALEIFNTFVFSKEETNKIQPLINKFQEYCTPKKNVTFERRVFNTMNQGQEESIDIYVTEFQKLARSCELCQLHNSLIKDRIICGIQNAEVKARLLRKEDLRVNACKNRPK